MRILIFSVLFYIPASLFALPLTDARNLALGGMVVSSSNIETSLFINPSYLSGADSFKTSFSQAKTSANNLDLEVSASFPTWKDNVGVGFGLDAQVAQNQQETGIVRDSNGQVVVDPVTGNPLTQVLGFFTQSNNVFYCSLGAKFGFCSLGASLKYFLSDFGNMEGTGFGLDLSFNAAISKDLSVGSTLFDLQNTTINFRGNAPNIVIPSTWMTSAGWNFWHDDHLSFLAEPGFSSAVSNPSSLQWAAGMEGSWDKSIFARVGVNQNRISFGIGLVAHLGKVFNEVKIDYAYLGGNTNDFPSRLTLTTTW
jgi:hypothetical protein